MSHHNEPNLFLVYIASGSAFFATVNYFTRYFVPHSANQNPQQRWKWRNVMTSLIHSIITAIWAPLTFWLYPEIRNDLIESYNYSIHLLVSISIGYFVYDALDMFIYHRKRSTYELLIHHFSVILCFGIGAFTRRYLAYASVALVVEINSVFLHIRQLFIIQGVSKHQLAYRNNALLNVITFVFFRILLLGWMTRWITLHRDVLAIQFFTCGSLGLATIVVMNIILFYRIIISDYSRSKKLSNNGQTNGLPSKPHMNGYHLPVNRLVKSLFDEEKDKAE